MCNLESLRVSRKVMKLLNVGLRMKMSPCSLPIAGYGLLRYGGVLLNVPWSRLIDVPVAPIPPARKKKVLWCMYTQCPPYHKPKPDISDAGRSLGDIQCDPFDSTISGIH